MSDSAQSPREAFLESYEAIRTMLLATVAGKGDSALWAARDLLVLEKERMAFD